MRNEMIVIIDCTTVLVDRDEFYIDIFNRGFSNGAVLMGTLENPLYESVEVTREHIQGKIFHNGRGDKICLGLSTSASKSLKFPFEVIENQQRQIQSLEHNHKLLVNERDTLLLLIERRTKMSFYTKFKFLLGVIK